MAFDLKSLISGGVSDLIKEVKDTVHTFVTTGKDKQDFEIKEQELGLKITEVANAHVEKMAEVTQAEVDSYLKDKQSAREANARIQESDKASWLSKNVAYLIDIFVTLMWGGIALYIISRAFKLVATGSDAPDMNMIWGIFSAITAAFMTVLTFHRGSSRGSEVKQAQLDKMYSEK